MLNLCKLQVFHPNVNFKTGEICLDILKREWTPAWSLEVSRPASLERRHTSRTFLADTTPAEQFLRPPGLLGLSDLG